MTATESRRRPARGRRDPWAVPNLLLWAVFLAAGFHPEYVFDLLREVSWLVPTKAFILVNAPIVITFSFAMYVSFFALLECQRYGVGEFDALFRSVQLGVLAVFAFLPVSTTLYLWAGASSIAFASLRLLAWVIGPTKVVAWVILVLLVLCYYGFGCRRVFVLMLRVSCQADADGETAPKAST